jgi:L-lactate dehydrogenase complex protein LldE
MRKVSLFIPCFVDQLVPEVGIHTLRVLRRAGCEVDFPKAQTCCGQPAFNTGYWDDARVVAERFLRVFRSADAVVCPSGSCTTMVRNFYPELLMGRRSSDEAAGMAKRVFEFSEFLVKELRTTDVGSSFPHRVAFHDACHGLRELGLKEEPRELLRRVRSLELVEMPASEECCGFGGTFAVKYGVVSASMGETKAANAEASGAEYLASIDPSCLLHMDGILRRRQSRVRTIHLASILAQTAEAAERARATAEARSAS